MRRPTSLEQLRILVAIEDTGSFSAAGRKLARVQSAISQAVRTMEEDHEIELFDRSTRNARLTEAGRVLARQARQVLRQASLFESAAQAITSGIEPELGLAVDCFVPSQPVIESLQLLHVAFPDLSVALYTEGLGAPQRRIRDRTASLAIGALLPTAAQDLQSFPLFAVRLLPVVASSHALATEARPCTRDLLSEHVQLVLTDAVDPSGPSNGVVSQRTWRFVDLSRRLEFLLAGFGWATMPAHLVAPFIKNGRLRELSIADPGLRPDPIPIYAVHDRSSPLGKAGSWFLSSLQQSSW